jgi:hypothetical protein
MYVLVNPLPPLHSDVDMVVPLIEGSKAATIRVAPSLGQVFVPQLQSLDYFFQPDSTR